MMKSPWCHRKISGKSKTDAAECLVNKNFSSRRPSCSWIAHAKIKVYYKPPWDSGIRTPLDIQAIDAGTINHTVSIFQNAAHISKKVIKYSTINGAQCSWSTKVWRLIWINILMLSMNMLEKIMSKNSIFGYLKMTQK